MFNPRRPGRRGSAGESDPATGASTEERQRDLKPLLRLWPYLRPHKLRILGAGVALVIGAVSTLVLGGVLRSLVDKGFARGNVDFLDEALLFMLGAVAFMALAAYMRMYLGNWLGERLVADMRKALFRHLLGLDLTFYETAKTSCAPTHRMMPMAAKTTSMTKAVSMARTRA